MDLEAFLQIGRPEGTDDYRLTELRSVGVHDGLFVCPEGATSVTVDCQLTESTEDAGEG